MGLGGADSLVVGLDDPGVAGLEGFGDAVLSLGLGGLDFRRLGL